MKRLVISLILCLLPLYLPAAVSVTGVTGTLTHGSSVTISGSGFGTKATAAPFTWENFETGGANLDVLDGVHSWQWYNGNGFTPSVPARPHFSTIDAHSGSFCMRNMPPASHGYFNSEYKTGLNSTTLYFSCWYKFVVTGDTGSSGQPIKFIRMSSTPSDGDPYYSVPGKSTFGWTYKTSSAGVKNYFEQSNGYAGGGSEGIPGNEESEVTLNPTHSPATNEPTEGQAWGRVEALVTLSTPGVSDGTIALYWNGHELFNSSTVCTRHANNPSIVWDSFILPSMPQDQGTAQWDTRVDDVYIDTTQARVEIGDASTWAACTHKEVQPATSWSASSAIVTLNRGSFGTSDTAYVYVVDSTGAVNSSGYQITFGGSGSGAVPSLCGGKFNKN